MWKLLAMALALALPGAAQTEAALKEAEVVPTAPATIRRLVPEVQMVIAVEDHHGHPRPGLAAAQIRILDNGAAARVTSFEAAAGLPLRIALLLDGSGSMQAGFAAAREAGLALLRQAQNWGATPMFNIVFATTQAEGDGTAATGVLSAGQAEGQTALYDALIHAAGLLASQTSARRVLFLLSDGEDNYSRASLADAIAALQSQDIVVYCVAAHSARLEFLGDLVLRQIAAATGGRAYLLSSYSHAGKAFAKIETQLRGEYVVGFRPAGRLEEGEFHSVKITAPGAKIRARPGYYVGR